MTVIDLQQRGTGGSGGDFVALPTDTYLMKITEAKLEENQYGDPKPDGSKPLQVVLAWEVYELTPDQDDEDGGESYLGQKVWQRFNPYYGPVRDGGVSRFQQFIDALRDQGLLQDFNPGAFDISALVGIQQRVNVEKYKKSQGPNAGKDGNKVVGVMPIRRKKTEKAAPTKPRGAVEEEDLPF